MYKIVTLCKSFHFFEGEKAPKAEKDLLPVMVKRDFECDVSLDFDTAYTERRDLLRAAAIYLFSVRGLPSSEYKIRTPWGVFSAEVPRKRNKIFGGNFEKCKLIFTEENAGKKNEEISFYTVLTEMERVRIALCDSVEAFDMPKVGKRVLREDTSPAEYVAAVSATDGVVSFKCMRFDGTLTAATPVYAAVYCLLNSLGICTSESRIRFGDTLALCRPGFGGAFVFDCAPTVVKLF